MAKKTAKKSIGFEELNKKLDRVIDTMATRVDIERLDKRIDKVDEKVNRVIDAMATRDDIVRLERRMDEFDKKFDRVMKAIDGLAKAVGDLTLEYAAVKMQLARHEEWIRLIAERAGVKLPR